MWSFFGGRGGYWGGFVSCVERVEFFISFAHVQFFNGSKRDFSQFCTALMLIILTQNWQINFICQVCGREHTINVGGILTMDMCE